MGREGGSDGSWRRERDPEGDGPFLSSWQSHIWHSN